MAEYIIKTHYKKSCEQIEYFYNRKIPNAKIIVRDGFRRAEFRITTTDDNFPAVEFDEVPDGDGKKDSLDLFNLVGDNIEDTEMIEMFDGGCWGDVEFEGLTLEQEEELREFIEETGAWALEDKGDWYLEETQCWVWGPLEITDEAGNSRVIIADEDGTMIDFTKE